MKRAKPTVVLLALGALVLAGCGGGQPTAAAATTEATNPPGITARGTGTVTGTPDTVTVVLGVQTRDDSATSALDANTAQATALIDVLKDAGVAAEDLQTSGLSIHPTYDSPSGRITGYEVTNQVTATVRDISAAGALIDAAAAAVGDAVRVQQLSFSIDDDSALRAQARADAVRRALAQAAQMAEAAGVSLGPIRSVREVPTDPPTPYALDGAAAAERAAVPLEPGTQELSVVVEVVHGIDA
jgi:uncharacterized protein YggE